MGEDDSGVAHPHCNRRDDEFSVSQCQKLSSHQSRDCGPGNNGDGNNNTVERRRHDSDQDDPEYEGWNCLKDLGEPHQDTVDHAAEVSGQAADHHTDENGDQGRGEPDKQGHSGTPDNAGSHVPTKAVRPQRKDVMEGLGVGRAGQGEGAGRIE